MRVIPFFKCQSVRNPKHNRVPSHLLIAGPLALTLCLSSGCEQERYSVFGSESPCVVLKNCNMEAEGVITTSNAVYLEDIAVFLATIESKDGVLSAILEIVDGCGESFFIGPFKDGQKGKVRISGEDFNLFVSEITKDSAHARISVSCD